MQRLCLCFWLWIISKVIRKSILDNQQKDKIPAFFGAIFWKYRKKQKHISKFSKKIEFSKKCRKCFQKLQKYRQNSSNRQKCLKRDSFWGLTAQRGFYFRDQGIVSVEFNWIQSGQVTMAPRRFWWKRTKVEKNLFFV